MFKKTLLVAAVLVASGATFTSMAATNPATTTFQVTLKIQKACSVTATNMDFGTQDASATNVAQVTNGSVTVTCSKGTAYAIGLAPSNASTVGAGVMSGVTNGNTDKVPYQLYQNAGLTTVWGNTAGTNTVAGVGTGAAASAVSVYGKVPSADFTPDSYADTVTVNVTY